MTETVYQVPVHLGRLSKQTYIITHLVPLSDCTSNFSWLFLGGCISRCACGEGPSVITLLHFPDANSTLYRDVISACKYVLCIIDISNTSYKFPPKSISSIYLSTDSLYARVCLSSVGKTLAGSISLSCLPRCDRVPWLCSL